MASTPFFFFFSGLLFLAWFTAGVHSVKVIDVFEGSTVVLRPVESVTSITSITWKHGDNLAVDWFKGDLFFYNIFEDTCSLNTETGELTINNVRLEHSGVYTPDINGRTRSALILRVLLKILPDVLKGSSVVLRPVEAVTSITAITWKHGDKEAAEWVGGNKAFYNIFKDTCSLNTTTGELTINNVRPEHSGVYTPYINGKTRSAMKLRVLSPVPIPSITMNCNPEKTNCNLTCTLTLTLTCSDTCKIDRTDDLGDVEVFWILDDSRVNGPELQITKDTKTETFICSLKNSVSSENSTKLLNPLLLGVPMWKPVIITLAAVAVLALLVGWIYLKQKRYWINKIIKVIRETMPVTEHDRILAEIHTSGPVTDVDLKLVHADWMILCILREGDGRNLSADSILRLLTARYLILWILQQRYQVQKSLDKVKDIIEKYFRGKQELNLSDDEKQKLQNVDVVIASILMKEKLKLYEEEKQKLVDFTKKISAIIIKSDDEVGQRSLNAASNVTSRPRDPAAELLISSSRFEAEDKV